MINVFKKRTSLYALTASALFLLQGVDASIASGAGPGPGPGAGGAGAVPGAGAGAGAVPGAAGAGGAGGLGAGGLGAGGLGAGGVQGGANACNVASYKDFNAPLLPVVCNDRTEHSMKYSTVIVKKEGGNALTVGSVDVVGGSAETAKPTIVKLYSSSLWNRPTANANQDAQGAVPQYGSAVFVLQDGVIELKDSWVRDFDTGLFAFNGGKIVMKKGKVLNAIMGAEAINESLIMLRDTEMNVSGQQWVLSSEDEEDEDEDEEEEDLLGDEVTAFRVSKGSVIDMKSGKVAVPIGATVVSAEKGGIIQLDNVSVIINGSNPNDATQLVSSLSFVEGGFISFKNENINHSNVIGVWAFGHDDENSNNNRGNDATSVKHIGIDEASTEFLASSDYVNYLIPQILGEKTRAEIDKNRIAEERIDEPNFKIRASIKSSTINLRGERSIGVYFDNQPDDPEQSQNPEQSRKSNQLQNKESLVLLQDTTLKVPDGTAISGHYVRGSVLIDSGSNVSGDSFLKTRSTSEVSVFVNDSIVRGEANVEVGSQGKLFLFNGSKWHLTKSRFAKNANSCKDSCISSVRLDNSTISFLPFRNGADQQADQQADSYQMLRIGNGKGAVYTASGNSHIYFRASVPADASGDSQLSDRLLIHGDVSGQTKVHVHSIRRNGDAQQVQDAQGYKPQSISIIQVYGEARKDSFTLNDAYVTIGGSPYQYILRAYGPVTPPKMKYFDNKLANSKQIWDYRLEGKIEAADGTKVEPPLASEIVLAEYNIWPAPRLFNIVPDLEYLDSVEVSEKKQGDAAAGIREVAPALPSSPDLPAGSPSSDLPAGPSSPDLKVDAVERSDTGDVNQAGDEDNSSRASGSSSTPLQTVTTGETVNGNESRRNPNPYMPEGTFSYGEELVTSDGDTGIYLLSGGEYSRQNAEEVEYNIIGYDGYDIIDYDDFDTDYGGYTIVGVNSLGPDRPSPLPEAEDGLMGTTDEYGLTQTVEPSVTLGVSERSESVDPAVPNTLLISDTGQEDLTNGGYDGVVSEVSEVVTSLPSPTTSSVISTGSGEDASTDLVRSDIGDVSHEEAGNEPSTISNPSSTVLHTLATEETVGESNRGTDSYILGETSSYDEGLVTSDEDRTDGESDGVESEASETVASLPAPTKSPVTSTVSERDASPDQGEARTSEVVSTPSPTKSPVTSTVSEGGASTDPRRAGTSEVVSTPSPTKSPVTSTVSGGDASTNLVRSETSGHDVYSVLSNSSPSSVNSVTLISSGANSLGRSDTGRISVISTDGISVSSGHTISNRLPSIKSAASIKPSTSETTVKPVALSKESVGRILVPSHSANGNVSSKEAIASTCDDVNNGEKKSRTTYLCSDGKSRTIKNFTLKASDKAQHPIHVKNQDTVIKLEGAIISGADFSDSENNVDFTTSKRVSTVLAEDNGEVVLDKKSKIQSSVIGLEAQSGGKVKMTDGTVDALYVGALAGSGSSVNLKDTKINVTGDLAAAGLVSLAGKVSMDSGAITLTKGVAVRSEAGGSVELDKVDITAKKGQGKLDSADNFGRAAFLLSDNASVDFKNGNVVTDAHALWIMKSDDNVVETGSSRRRRSSEVRPTTNHANIESSIVRVEGDGTYGIYFDGGIQKEASQQNRSEDLATEKAIVVKRSTVSKQEKTPISITGTVSLKKTDFEVASGIAIYGNNSGGHVSLENKTTLVGDLLLKADNDSNISVLVDSSIVKGDVRVDKSSYAKLDLINQSEWILKRSAQRNLGTPDLGCVDSCISSVSLVNSTIDFASSESEGKYQTLHIGNGKGIVYAAQGNAAIHLNARLNPRDPSNQQVTDRLVIHGDVSGKTKIHVRGDAANVGDARANGKIAHSVSVIQVYGQAKKDSFQLDGNYVALRNSPYKYTLRAYGPEATSKQEHVQQKFVKDGGEFWNFRLENQYVKSVGSAVLPEQFVRSVVPQVPTYLVLPNSVFHAGLMDISNQNKQLETLRMTSTGMVEVRENPALYLRGYGGSYRYASDLSALEYGYGGDLDYHGVEAGVLLQTIENADSAISFGVMGTYGKLSLQPLNVEQSQKSAFDKWTATVYGSMQHNAGFYVDGLLSYGLFKGDVLTLARGKTATLKGNPLSVSLAGGQTIATGYKGFVFDPQVQVVYQHLQFNKARDIDNFDIEMGNLNQWVARVGGRLTKIPTGSEGVNAIAFYGKLYLAHGFEGKQSVHFKDAFKLGAFGSSLEAGLGVNAKLLPQFSLHADILYQHKLNKAGFSGTSFSGGVRYQF
ncbi:autotransporter outer membrane beta-barrel domain-containing protein [Bartonella sp. SD1336NMGDW]|uniref:autotransporter outer membrane beta-barrel domain-containing protein n=1 Tax=Bartonella sp. SD1336NMGDW TaxID=3243575 RepID=UPI0035CE9E9A